MSMHNQHNKTGTPPPVDDLHTQKACREAEALLPAYSIGATDPDETRFVEAMLRVCPELKAVLTEYLSLSSGLLEVVPETKTPPAAEKVVSFVMKAAKPQPAQEATTDDSSHRSYHEIRELFSQSASNLHRPNTAPSAKESAALPEKQERITELPRQNRPGRWAIPAAFAAVVALFVLMNAYWLAQLQSLQQNQQGVYEALNARTQDDHNQQIILNNILETQASNDESIAQLIEEQQLNQEKLLTLLEAQQMGEQQLTAMIAELQGNQDELMQFLSDQQMSQVQLVQLINEQIVNQADSYTIGTGQQNHRQLIAAEPGQDRVQANFIWDGESEIGSLVATGLSALPPENVYQLWLVRDEDGMAVSLGFFGVDESGTGALIFQSPEPIDSFDHIGISIEAAGGNPQPTTPHIVIGEI